MNYDTFIPVEPQSHAFWKAIEEEERKKSKNSGISDKEYLNILNQYNEALKDVRKIEVGQVVSCFVEKISPREIIASFGYKDNIYIDNRDKKFLANVEIGEEMDVLVTEIIERPYQIKGSISEIIRIQVQSHMKNYYEDQIAIFCTVSERNNAGFIVTLEIDGIEIKAFMPNTLAAPNKLTDEQSQELVGQKIEVCLETLQQERGYYVVSRKKFLEYHMFEEELSQLKKGKLYKGHVTGTTPFGVFIQFGCLTGMIHKVNLNDEFKSKVREEGKIDIPAGTDMKFYVKDIAKKGKQIILTQVLRESVWDKVRPGQEYTGKVASVKNFGVLVSLDPETLGLIQNTYLHKANRTFTFGEEIKVKVISVIKDDRKIYLDLVSN